MSDRIRIQENGNEDDKEQTISLQQMWKVQKSDGAKCWQACGLMGTFYSDNDSRN